jgi:hypothetical protein
MRKTSSFIRYKPLENEMRHGPKTLIQFFFFLYIYIYILIFQNYHSIIKPLGKKFYNICFLALNFIFYINTKKKIIKVIKNINKTRK